MNAVVSPPSIVRSRSRRFVLIAALAASAFTARPCRADHLDAALLKHAPEVMEYLRQHRAQNVGILKFRVHKAGHSASFKVGPINDNLVERLETALIAVNPPARPIGIIHNANQVAASRKLPRYDNPAGQRALFGQTYPLAWGTSQVKPDLMLTGVVAVRPDLKSATVTIEAFGPDSPKQDKVVSFKVDTDRSLLADLNESFKVSSRALKKKTRAIELDEDAVTDAVEDNEKPAAKTGGDGPSTNRPASTSSEESPLYYEIRYDGVAQPVTADPASPGELHVAEPKENQVVSFYLKSQSAERLGLVLMVNGKSTLYEEEMEPIKCKAWVIDPGHEYGVYGYQVDNNTRKPFRVLSDADSAATTYSANTGLIQFHIFKSGGSSGEKEVSEGEDVPNGGEPGGSMNISLRGLNRAGHTRSLADLQALVKRPKTAPTNFKPKRLKRGLIVSDNAAVEGAIKNDEVQNPVFVQSIVVRYYKPKGQ